MGSYFLVEMGPAWFVLIQFEDGEVIVNSIMLVMEEGEEVGSD